MIRYLLNLKFIALQQISFSFFCLLIVAQGFGQQKSEDTKYPSLLWEISGNELTEPSYLYGTMHVSEKVAYHLSDTFFENVLSADAIALETSPENWLDEIQKLPDFFNSNSYYYDNSFYQSFAFNPLVKDDLISMFFLSENLVNGILYRKSDFRSNYEENTYLDMFLYQVGKRTGKDVISLENYRESNDLALQAEMNNAENKPNRWVQEQLQESTFDQLLSDAYREKNLDYIDSLNVGLNSKKYMDLMITERNRNMVDELVPIIKDGTTVFTGVGAAHLPGNNGMIEMLREEGFTVKPILGEYTNKGLNAKKELDKKYIRKKLQLESTSDNDFKILSPNKIYDFSLAGVGLFVGLDLPNSSYLSVIKAPRRDYLRKDDYRLNPQTLDSLYFENIPGEIIEKKPISINGYNGWDIKSETVIGNRQRYVQLLTPLELITVLYNGNDDFIESNEDEIINSIDLKSTNGEWEVVEPFQKGFSVEVPDNNIIYNNSAFTAKSSPPVIEAYDEKNESYYFVQQKTLGDISYLEETNFELERIAYVFLDQLKVDTLNSHFKKATRPEFYTSGKLNNDKTLHLKSFQRGPFYYLMGTTGDDDQKNKFFNSFKHKSFNYFNEKVNYVDSTMHFSVTANIDVAQYDYRGNSNNENVFKSVKKTRVFSSEAKEKINVEYFKFHKYEKYDMLDSLWYDLEDSKQFESTVLENKKAYEKENWNILDLEHIDTLNTQRIKTRYLQNGSRLYTIQTMLDKDDTKNEFVDEFYESFQPKDTVIGKSIFEEKVSLFLNDIHHEADSIRNSAWKSINYLDFEAGNLENLKTILTDYEYKDELSEHEASIYRAIGDIDSNEANQFLLQQYKERRGKSDIQIEILKSIAEGDNENKYETIFELMDYDLPLPSKSWQVNSLFKKFEKDADNSKSLFPEIFQLYSVEEYKDPIARFTKNILDSTSLKTKTKKAIKKGLLTNAKLELKRVESKIDQLNNGDQNISTYQLSDLKNYIDLMSHFKNEKDVQLFFNDVRNVEEPRVRLLLIENELKKDIFPSKQMVDEMLKDSLNQFYYYDVIHDSEKTSLIKQFSEQQIAMSLMNFELEINEKKDSIEFVKVEHVSTNSYNEKEEYKIFFIKTLIDSEYQTPIWKMNYVGFNLDENGFIDPDSYLIKDNLEYFSDEELERIYKTAIDFTLHNDRRRTIYTYY